jgi:hypothetical protein
MEDAVGNLVMHLYIVDDTSSASYVNEGRSDDLLQGVIAGMLEVQCNVGLVMVLEKSVDGTNACDSLKRRSLQSRQDDSVVWTTARVSVTDELKEDGEKYMNWTVVFPVLQIGAHYVDIGGDEALVAMQAETGTALSEYIQGGDMDTKLPDTAKSYAVDQEIGDTGENDDWRYSGEIKSPIDPDPFHTLRMTGVVLFFVTAVFSFLLVKIASRRKLEREMDVVTAKNKLGGLVTEEGLDLMLETGRRESLEAGLSGHGFEEEMLAASRSYMLSKGEDDNEGMGFRYLPSSLSPSKIDMPQAKAKDVKGDHEEDAGLDLCDSNLNVT